MTISESLSIYRESVVKAKQYASDAFIQDSAGNYVYDEQQRDFIVDAAILKFFKAWETFLESTFKCYLLGEQTTEGTTVHICVTARDENHADKLLIGMNKYFDWANPEFVCKLSVLYLDEINPINASLNAIKSDLSDFRTIRNAAAHFTVTTRHPVEALAQRKTGNQHTGITPAKFIFMQESTTGDYWNYYQQILDIAAENIAKGVI